MLIKWFPHLLCPFTAAADAAAKDELAAEVAEEAGKIGDIAKLSLFSKHPEGVIMIKFKSSGAAAEAISTFNGRWFGGRQIVCQFYDGVTDYRWVCSNTQPALTLTVAVGLFFFFFSHRRNHNRPLLHAPFCVPFDGVPACRVKDVDTSAAADEEAKRLDEFGKWLESGGE